MPMRLHLRKTRKKIKRKRKSTSDRLLEQKDQQEWKNFNRIVFVFLKTEEHLNINYKMKTALSMSTLELVYAMRCVLRHSMPHGFDICERENENENEMYIISHTNSHFTLFNG